MPKHLHRDLDELSRELLTMGGMVEEATNRAVTAVIRRDADLARQVIKGDSAINEKENLIEEEALKILALHQPVAGDLRFIITALKVNNDLERIGDLTVNVCERVVALAERETVPILEDFNEMVHNVQVMVRDSLNALVDRDPELARSVIATDDRVDEVNRAMVAAMMDIARNEPNRCDEAISMMSVSRHLERIADLTTNIAEDIIFMVEGEIVRHSL